MRISDFAGHCGSPPAFIDCSLISNDLMKNGTDVMIMTIVSGSKKNSVADRRRCRRATAWAAWC